MKIKLKTLENLLKHCKFTYKHCVVCYRLQLVVLVKYNLFSDTYNWLTLAYKYLLLFLVIQNSHERSISTIKYLKIDYRIQ